MNIKWATVGRRWWQPRQTHSPG